MSSELGKLAAWTKPNRKKKGKGFDPALIGGKKIADSVVKSIVEDAKSGKYPSIRQVAKANSVSPMTARKYLREQGIELSMS